MLYPAIQQSHHELLPSNQPLRVLESTFCSSRPLSGPYLLPLAVGGELLGRNEEAKSEDGFQFSWQPLRLKVLKLRLRLPESWHIQTEAEHL